MWQKYKDYFLKHLNNSKYTEKDGLPYLRDRLFISIIFTAFPLSLLIYIPSMSFLLKMNAHIAVIVDSISVLVFAIILFYRNLSISIRKLLFFFNFYILALSLLVLLGAKGPGLIIFLVVSILCTLLISKKAGMISVVIIAATLFFLLFGFSFETKELALFQEYNRTRWFFTSLNFSILNLIIVFILAFFVDHLHNLVSSKQKLLYQLHEESKNLIKAKEKSEESDRLKSAFWQI